MGYTTYDFSETLNRVGIEREQVAVVLAAWGKSPEGYGSWDGGFLLEMIGQKVTPYTYVTGWCDTSGWGCQDGATVYRYAKIPSLVELPSPDAQWFPEHHAPPDEEWDHQPADLNRFIQGLTTRWDDAV